MNIFILLTEKLIGDPLNHIAENIFSEAGTVKFPDFIKKNGSF